MRCIFYLKFNYNYFIPITTNSCAASFELELATFPNLLEIQPPVAFLLHP